MKSDPERPSPESNQVAAPDREKFLVARLISKSYSISRKRKLLQKQLEISGLREKPLHTADFLPY